MLLNFENGFPYSAFIQTILPWPSARDSESRSIPSLNVNGKVVTEDGKIAEAFNMHFVSVGPKLAENITSKQSDNPLKYIKSNDSATFVLEPVTSFQVLMCLNQLKNGKACGSDKVATTLEKMQQI